MYTLGIETSCDETSVAVADNKKILSNVVTSSVHLHCAFGGVVPEIASRFHLEYINTVLKDALRTAGIGLKDLRLIAVTKEPGLIGSLLVGLSFARGLSYALSLPLLEVNHLIAHIYACLMQFGNIRFPLIGFIVSGGHTCLYHMDDIDRWTIIGQTRDDAAGEAFDKVAKLLGLGYPGGPAVEERAALGDAARIKFPRSNLKRGEFDFSFSGIKTAVLYYVMKLGAGRLKPDAVNDICAGFQETVCDMIVEKCLLACRKKGIATLLAGGGVIANKRLREKLRQASERCNVDLYFPSPDLCLDNGAMTAGLGEALYRKGLSEAIIA